MEEKQDVFFSKCMLGTDDQEDENCQRSGNFHFVSVCFCPVETGCSSVVPQPSMMVNCKWLSPSFLLLTFLPCSTLCFAPWLMFESHLSAAAASVLALSSHFFCWKRDKETKPTREEMKPGHSPGIAVKGYRSFSLSLSLSAQMIDMEWPRLENMLPFLSCLSATLAVIWKGSSVE